ncbi:MAG: MFS transporter [Acidaminococcales bacterium]|jgi:OFA family oxalate/formate antiporter-like MFS transporter|nr:MFS transporter [Acidaminococcales bacterium]
MLEKLKRIFGRKEPLKVLLACMLSMSALGFIYIWSVFIIPLENEFGWTRADISLVYTCVMFSFAVGMAAGGFLNSFFSMDKTIFAAMLIIAASFMIASFSGSLLLLLVSFGIFASVFMGVIYNTMLYAGNLWFNEDGPSVSGLLQTCLGISTVILGFCAAELLRMYDWRFVFRLMGLIIALSLFIGSRVIKVPSAGAGRAEKAREEYGGVNWRQMLATKNFWFLWTIRLIIVAGGIGLIGHAVPAALELGVSYDTAVLSLGILSFANAFGRMLCGLSWEYMGFRKTMALSCLLFIASFSILSAAYSFSGGFAVVLACGLCGLSYGSVNLIGVSFTRDFFGMKHFSENYGIVTTPMLLSSFIGPYLMGEIKMGTGHYYSSFVIFIFLGLVSLVLVMLVKKPAARQK